MEVLVMQNLERAVQIMDREELDGIIASSLPNLLYLSGFWDANSFVFPYDTIRNAVASKNNLSQPILIVGQGDLDLTTDLENISDTVGIGAFSRYISDDVELTSSELLLKTRAIDREGESNQIDALCKTIQMAGLSGRVGLDQQGINFKIEDLRAKLPNLEIVSASKVFSEIRMIKTASEIAKLKAAVAVTEESLLGGINQLKEGTSEWELERNIRMEMVSRDAMPTFVQIKFGRNGGFEQRARNDVLLKQGDTIWVDLGCMLDGYCSDIARTFSIGQPTDRVQTIYDALLAGETAALEFSRPGVTAKDVFNTTIESVREAGLPDYYKQHVGHGIGVETYDPPLLSPNDDTVLEANMVLDIEPPIYILGLGAFHVEDTFVITEDGTQLLTSIDRSLQVVNI